MVAVAFESPISERSVDGARLAGLVEHPDGLRADAEPTSNNPAGAADKPPETSTDGVKPAEPPVDGPVHDDIDQWHENTSNWLTGENDDRPDRPDPTSANGTAATSPTPTSRRGLRRIRGAEPSDASRLTSTRTLTGTGTETGTDADRSQSSAKNVGRGVTNTAAAKSKDGKPLSRRQLKRARKRRRPRLRFFPRSVLGISLLLLAAGMGAAASGTALYMNYAYRKDLSDAQVKSLPEFVKRWKGQLDAEGTNAQKRIQDELEPLLKQAAIGETLERILSNAQPSVWAVHTFDTAGGVVVGTAFVVASDSDKSFLLTSFDVVQTSSAKPGPEITVQKGNEQLPATLWTWQEDRDLALLIVNKGSLPRLEWAPAADTHVGTQVFGVSGFGTAGGAITNGFVADVSQTGMQHSAAVGTSWRGGPLLNEKGLVVAVLSRTYAPFGFKSEGVWFAPPVASACLKLLKCPNGVVSGAGAQR